MAGAAGGLARPGFRRARLRHQRFVIPFVELTKRGGLLVQRGNKATQHVGPQYFARLSISTLKQESAIVCWLPSGSPPIAETVCRLNLKYNDIMICTDSLNSRNIHGLKWQNGKRDTDKNA